MCGDGSPVIFRILCVSASEGVGGALMALVRSRWGRGGAREEKMNLKRWLREPREKTAQTQALTHYLCKRRTNSIESSREKLIVPSRSTASQSLREKGGKEANHD